MRNILKIKILSVLIMLSSGFGLNAQVSADEGKTLFKNFCAACHVKDMKTDLTGPALGGVEERWADYDRVDLYSWIRNSQSMINDAKHPKAVELWNTN